MNIFGYAFTAFFTLLSFFIYPQQHTVQENLSVYVNTSDMHAYSDEILDSDGSEEIVYATYETIVLSDELCEKYPALADYIENYNSKTKEYANHTFDENIDFIEENEMHFDFPYYEEHYARIYRFDDNIFSLKETVLGYAGGAHGYDLIGCINIDPNTGEELELSDVLANDSNLSRIVDTAIRKAYPDEYEYMHDVYETLLGYTTNEYQWTMTNDCLYINFNTYEIASYAAGQITVPLYFADHPGLVRSKYTETEENSFVRRVGNYDHLYLTDQYGSRFSTNFYSYSSYETGRFRDITFVLENERMEFTLPESDRMNSWHARSESGKNYLIVELHDDENDTVTLEIYLLEKNNVKKISTLRNTEMPKISYEDPELGGKSIDPAFTSWDKVAGFIE